MEIEGRTVLVLGGSGLVGLAVARRMLRHRPRAIVLSALSRSDAETAVLEIRGEAGGDGPTTVIAEWGDIFLPEAYKDLPRAEVLEDPAARAALVDDLFGAAEPDAIERSALGALLLRHRPGIVVDCVSTATVFAYQDAYASAGRLRRAAAAGQADLEAVECHLATLYLPQLIRHAQIALEAMRRAGTGIYLKIGTAGTGGMGLNVPFTHSEDRPSKGLLAKASLAGAHTLLLYLMARTPGGPAVKEIKPTAAISWKRIGFGEIRRRGRPIDRFDATRAAPLGEAFGSGESTLFRAAGGHIRGVFLDAGENGLFSLGEFEALTALGLMEFITPEEIAENVEREVRGLPTGRDVIAALDASTSGPTYRAGVLRQVALERMEALERESGVDAVAYEMLGPPRLSKLLFEAAFLARLFPDLPAAAVLDPAATAAAAEALILHDDELRVRILSIGLPILLATGDAVLRGPEVRVRPPDDAAVPDPRLFDQGWIDLRPSNWDRWRQRILAITREADDGSAEDRGSRTDVQPGSRRNLIRPGRLAAWIFRYEDRGERVKR